MMLIKKFFVVIVLGILPALCSAAWEPEVIPNPQEILDTIDADIAAAHYEDALAKMIWFRAHALEINPNLYGVRNSFALIQWKKLGHQYLPALDQLVQLRDDAVVAVQNGDHIRNAFADVAAIDMFLGEEANTKGLFLWLDSNHPDFASEVYSLAQRALLLTYDYSLCGKYLKPEESMQQYILQFHEAIEFEKTQPYIKKLNFASQFFTNRATTLIALLVRNGQSGTAARMAAEALTELPDKSFHTTVAHALNGEVPAPWPKIKIK